MKADFKDTHPQLPGPRRGGKRAPKRPETRRGATANRAGKGLRPWLLFGLLVGLFAVALWYLNIHAPTLPPAPGHAEADNLADTTPTATSAPTPSASAPTTVVPRAEPSKPAAPVAQPAVIQAPAPATPVEPAASTPATTNKGPDWHFYQLLEDQKVEVPVDHIRALRADKAPDPAQRMALQVGSFRNAADAEREKARFALLGYQTEIVVTDSEKYGTWHRLRIGPYDDPRKLAKDRAKLYSQHIDTLPVKIGD